jgi:hypothetical protein
MSASALSMHEWIDAFHASMAMQLEQIHPSAQSICHEYFGAMHAAVAAVDMG